MNLSTENREVIVQVAIENVAEKKKKQKNQSLIVDIYQNVVRLWICYKRFLSIMSRKAKSIMESEKYCVT